LKKHVEPLVTRAKEDTTHNRRIAFSFLQSKEAIKTLFGEISEKVATRPGGYTRIIKTGFRLGDNAEMCIIELVDFNELMLKDAKPAKKTTRRSRRGGASKAEGTQDTQANEAKAENAEAPAKKAKDTKADNAEASAKEEKPSEENTDSKDDNKAE